MTRIAVCITSICWMLLVSRAASAITSFDQNDFIISRFDADVLEVYDHDFSFKGVLDDSLNLPLGLDFTAAGQLVAVGRDPGRIKTYSPSGATIGDFVHSDIGDAFDLKIGPNGRLYVGTQMVNSVREFDSLGNSLRTLRAPDATYRYLGVAMLPSNVLWAAASRGAGGPLVDAFDIATGNHLTSSMFDGGQIVAHSMFFSSTTNTVLMTDIDINHPQQIVERDLSFGLVRIFSHPEFGDGGNPSYGVTRGPNGDVYAAEAGGFGRIFQWHADGTFMRAITPREIDGLAYGVDGIVWAGNAIIPEPMSATLLVSSIACLASLRVRWS